MSKEKAKTTSSSKLAEQGTPIGPNGNRLDNGKPNLAPTAGYDGHYPVQFDDETDEMFAMRVAMFEDSYSTAVNIEEGGENLESQIKALDAKHEAEVAALKASHEAKAANRAETMKAAEAQAKSETKTAK
jgi:hypothetical protein